MHKNLQSGKSQCLNIQMNLKRQNFVQSTFIPILVLTMTDTVYIQTPMEYCAVHYTMRLQFPYKSTILLYCPVKSPPK